MSPWLIGSSLGVAILCVATSSILIRFSTAPSLTIAFYRLLFTALLALLLGRFFPIKRVACLSRQDHWLLAGAGLAMALHFATWITSLRYTSVASSVLFTNLQVIFVTAIAWLLLKEKLSLVSILGIGMTLIGSIVVGGGDLTGGHIYGDILSLLSGFFIAVALIIGRRVRINIDLWSYLFAISIIAALVLLVVDITSGTALIGYSYKEVILFFLMALLPGIGGHGLFNWALRYVKAPIVSVAVLGETIGASLLAWWLFKEGLALYQLIGGLAVIAGIIITVSGERKRPVTDITS